VHPEHAAAAINRALCQHVSLGRFVTLFVSIYDLPTRTLRFCNAGHNPPIVAHADGRVTRLTAGGLVAGAFDTARYEGGAIALAPGDRVCLFTDGLPEATAASGAEFGDARLVDVIAGARDLDPAAIVDVLFSQVQAAAGGPCQDDATALVIGVR
jgi:sigma-B regulation protein RsbU (phosphoserine phosphatase)